LPSQTHDCQAPRSQDSHSSLGTDSLRERERDLQKPCVPIPAAYLGGGGEEEEEGFQANAVNEVDGERDRAVGRRTELTPLGDLWVEVLAFRV
jgi:hypothetical protein